MRGDGGLWPVPPPRGPPPFARAFVGADYRGPATWTPVKLVRPVSCDECFALQHETRGAAGHRADARFRRTVANGGPVLLLCSRHAASWHERDELERPR